MERGGRRWGAPEAECGGGRDPFLSLALAELVLTSVDSSLHQSTPPPCLFGGGALPYSL